MREAYLIVVSDPAGKEGYLEGHLHSCTFNLVSILLHAQGNAPQAIDGTYVYLKVGDGGVYTKFMIGAGGMIALEIPLAYPLGDYLRMSLADMRAALLGGMRASDAREMVEPIVRVGEPADDSSTVDLNAARAASNGDDDSKEAAPKKSKRA